MSVRFSGSLTTLAVSLAAILGCLQAATALAGDKIDFSAPANLQPAPERPKADVDNDDALKLPKSSSMGAPGMALPQMTILIEPDPKKDKGLSGWDNSFTPRDRDAKSLNELYNPLNHSSTSTWSNSWDNSFFGSRTGFGAGSGDAVNHGSPSENNQGGLSAWSSVRSEFQKEKPSHADGFWGSAAASPWTRALGHSDMDYGNRYQQEYTAGAASDALMGSRGGPTDSSFSASAMPGPVSSTSSSESWHSRLTGSRDDGMAMGASSYKFYSDGSRDTGAQRAPSRPSYSQSGGGYNDSRPAVLPFPKRPGSLFQ